MRKRLPESFFNFTSIIGALIAAISILINLFLFVLSVFFFTGNTYIGIMIYMIGPGIMIAGLIMIPIGMYFQNKKIKRGENIDKYPILDLNVLTTRNAFTIFVVGSIVLLFASAIGGYQAFHLSESNNFCGQLCHVVMKPEYTAYGKSAHAQVPCVDCHVGEGADWFVKAKLSGVYQVYAVLTNVFDRPIPTPITNLRPARETCEKCHWPEKFYSRTMRNEVHYLSDSANTRWDINLTVKVGSEISAFSLDEGSHWHINPDVKVEYIYTDEKRQEIPWVRYTNKKTGDTLVFNNEDDPLDPDSLGNYEMREMDCIDCHNRPSHNYRPPTQYINNAITGGDIPSDLPEIKAIAMEILSEEYSTTDTALTVIEEAVNTFYEDNYPEVFETRKAEIDKAIEGIRTGFSENTFPEMKVRWEYYPINIGHMEFNGCFRCHDGLHAEENSGEYIRRDCTLCHSINAQGTPGKMEKAAFGSSLEFKHPVDIEEEWKESLCTDCHTGLNP